MTRPFAKIAPLSKSISITALVIGMHGCAIEMHHGTQVTDAQVNSLRIGTTTHDEVVKSIGSPSWSAIRPNGEKVIGYARSTSRINAPSFATLTGAEPRTQFLSLETTMFIFDNDSKLIRVERPPVNGVPALAK